MDCDLIDIDKLTEEEVRELSDLLDKRAKELYKLRKIQTVKDLNKKSYLGRCYRYLDEYDDVCYMKIVNVQVLNFQESKLGEVVALSFADLKNKYYMVCNIFELEWSLDFENINIDQISKLKGIEEISSEEFAQSLHDVIDEIINMQVLSRFSYDDTLGV